MSARAKGVAIAAALVLGGLAGRVGAATFTTGTVPRFAYVTNLNSGTISQYLVDSTTGFLRPNGFTVCSSGGEPSAVVVDPSSKFCMAATFKPIFSTNTALDALISYSIDPFGRLVQQGSVAPFAGPNDFSFAPDGKTLYYPNVDQSYLVQYSVNQTNGTLSQLGGNVTTGAFPETVVSHPSLSVAYVVDYLDNNIAVYSRAANGALTETTTPATRVKVGTGAPGPVQMAVSPNGSFLYVAAYDTSSIYVYSINGSGALAAVGGATTNGNMQNPSGIVVDNSSKYVYTSNDGSDNVTAWRINSNGSLTAIASYAAGANPSRISDDPSGKFIYCVNRVSNTVSVFTINTTTGALTAAGTIRAQQQPYTMAVAAGSQAATYVPKFAYCSNSGEDTISQYSINATSGALSNLNPAKVGTVGSQPLWIEIEPSGRFLYALNRNDDGNGQRGLQAFTINGTTGQLTATGGIVGVDSGPRRFAIEPSGHFLYVVHDTAKTIGVYAINQTTGLLTRQTALTVTTTATLWGVTVDQTGQFLLLPDQNANTVASYAINATTGALTFVQNSAAGGDTPYTVRNDPSGQFVYVGNNGGSEWSGYTLGTTGTWGSLGAFNGNQNLVIQVDVHPSGDYCYGANFNSNTVTAWNIGSSGALSNRRSIGTGRNPQGMIIDPSGNFIYVPNAGSDSITEIKINQTTGNMSSIGTVNAGDTPHTVTIYGVLQ